MVLSYSEEKRNPVTSTTSSIMHNFQITLFAFLAIVAYRCHASNPIIVDTKFEIPTTAGRYGSRRVSRCSDFVPSGTGCSFYKKIRQNGKRVCAGGHCRSFKVTGLLKFMCSYLTNAFCACETTPKHLHSGRAVRHCLLRRVMEAATRGKTTWSVKEIEVDHQICYRAGGCPCGPAHNLAWHIVSFAPLSEFQRGILSASIKTFGRCNQCTVVDSGGSSDQPRARPLRFRSRNFGRHPR